MNLWYIGKLSTVIKIELNSLIRNDELLIDIMKKRERCSYNIMNTLI
jgi:hypothetical protein